MRCDTPVYIGSGKNLKAYEYIYNKDTQEVVFLDEHKWISFLAKNKLMDSYAEYVSQMAKKVGGKNKNLYKNENLLEWLVRNGVNEDETYKLALRRSFARKNVISSGGGGALNDVACCMSAPDGRPYIPGSSIKGALSTAIMYNLIRQNDTLKEKYWSKISNFGLKARGALGKGTLEGELMQELFCKLNLEKGNFGTKSVMRGLQVSDAICMDDVTTEVLEKRDANVADNLNIRDPENDEHGVALYRECIPSNTEFRVTISLDKRFLNIIGIKSIDELLKISHDFMQFNYDLQDDLFGELYGDSLLALKHSDLWIGGGAGFLSKTLVYALAPSRNEAKKTIAKHLDFVFKNKHKHVSTDKKLAPRALKIGYEGNSAMLMGCCSLNEVEQ